MATALPRAWPERLLVAAEVVVEGQVAGGLGPTAPVMAARRPSGLVPYCTGWSSLWRQKGIGHHYNNFMSLFGHLVR